MTYQKLLRLTGIGIIIAIWILSLIPIDQSIVPGSGHVHHFIAYFSCMFVWSQLYRHLASRLKLAVIFSLMGALIECAQGLTSYRHFSFLDMAVNAFSVLTALLVVTLLSTLHRRMTDISKP